MKARLYRVYLTRDGYIRKPDRMAGQYRGTGQPIWRLDYELECYPGGGEAHVHERYQEFRAHDRINAKLKAKLWAAHNYYFHVFEAIR